MQVQDGLDIDMDSSRMMEISQVVKKRKKLLNGENIEFIFPSGSKYIGDFQHGELCGFGTYYYLPSGDKYEGEWVSDMKHGHGKYTYASGDSYVGAWSLGKKHGRGTYSFSSGDKYVGFWKNDKIHGHGTFTIQSTGNRYEGFWEDSYRHGRGVLYHGNGDLYDGEWVKGKEEGFGILIQASTGNIYCGEWKAGEMDGKGILEDERVLYAVEFVNGYTAFRLPIEDDGLLPTEEWRKAYNYFFEYMGKPGRTKLLSKHDTNVEDELRTALEHAKTENLLWRKRYEDLLCNQKSKTSTEVCFSSSSEKKNGVNYEANKNGSTKQKSKTHLGDAINQPVSLDEVNYKETAHGDDEMALFNEGLASREVPRRSRASHMDVHPEDTAHTAATVESLRREIMSLQQHNVELMRQKDELEVQRRTSMAERDELERDLLVSRTVAESMESRLVEVTSLHQSALQEIATFHARPKSDEITPSTLNQEENHAARENGTQPHGCMEAGEKLKQVNQLNAELQIKLNALQKDSDECRSRYHTLLDQTHKGVSTGSDGDFNSSQPLRMEIQKLKRQLRDTEEAQRTMKVELDFRNSRCADLESTLLTLARQKTADPKILLSLDRKMDQLHKFQEENAELSRLLDEARAQNDILEKGTQVARERRRSLKGNEAAMGEEIEELQKELRKEQKRYKKASQSREKLSVELYEEQVKHARAERTLQNLGGCFTVVVRIRKAKGDVQAPDKVCLRVNEMDCSQILLKEENSTKAFQFDVCFDGNTHYEAIFNEIRRSINVVSDGFHVAYVTLGSLRSGKTTMMEGLLPLIVAQLCERCRKAQGDKYTVEYSVGAVEVSAAGAFDCESGSPITHIQREACGFVVPTGVTFLNVTGEESMMRAMAQLRQKQRPNRRSHMWIQIQCKMVHRVRRTVIMGRLTLVDLCGPGPLLRQEEDLESARFANRSFTHVMSVLEALKERSAGVPYTASVETALLADVFGGNAATTLLAALSEEEGDLDESRQTLRALEMASKSVNAPLVPRFISSDELHWREMVATTCSDEAAAPQLCDVDDLRDW